MNRKEQMKKLDSLWSSVVKVKANFTCEKCHAGDCAMESHHIIKRSHKRLRWHSDNGLCLCMICHEWAECYPDSFNWWMKDYHKARFVKLHLMKQEEIAPIILSELEKWESILKLEMEICGLEEKTLPF